MRALLASALLLTAVGLITVAPPALGEPCGKRYVATGDHLPAGHEVSESERYPAQLLEEHLKKAPGPWCVHTIAADGTTSTTLNNGGQLAQTWNLRPDLIVLTVGGENGSIIDLIDGCFDKVKDHDFTGAQTCASSVSANSGAFTTLRNNLITSFDGYKKIMSGRPGLVVAATGYPNPYPSASEVSSEVFQLCTPLVDTTQSCTTRWQQLPPALTALDSAIKKLNQTIADAVKPFTTATQGRFFFVDVYEKTRDHCMKMDVHIFTTVNHGEYQDEHDAQHDFGCSDPWYVEGSVGSKSPDYLDPASNGVLVAKFQTTSGMGIHPDEDGADCIADLVWETVKKKLGVPEPPAEPC